MLAKVRPQGSKLDHLFVGTQRFQYFVLAWDAEAQSLGTIKSFVDVSEKHMRDSQSRDRCLVDPTGKHLVMELFEGVLSFVRMNRQRRGAGGEYIDPPEQVRISELRVRSTCFLFTETNRPKLAILFDTGLEGDVRLATYRIVDEKAQYSSFDQSKDRENEIDELCVGASHLIPVPKGESEQRRYIVRNQSEKRAQVGGVIVVGETKMTYLDDESMAIVEYAMEEASIFVAWESYDDTRYFLADDYGNLHLLWLLVDESGFVYGMDMKKLGTTTKATVMIHLGDGLLFIASHEGDLELVQVNVEEGGIEVVQTMANIAPILDFAVMDLGGRDGESQSNEYASGQARLVTGSGAYEKGSLRSVRSGVGLEDIGILADMEDIQSVFSLRSSGITDSNDTVIVTLPTETRVFTFDFEGEIEEVENFRGLTMDEPTLLVTNLADDLLLQITSSRVRMLGAGPSFVVAEWEPATGRNITAVSANNSYILLAVDGSKLVTLDIKNGLALVGELELGEDEVACIHVSSSSLAPIGIVGFWKSGSISVLNLLDLSVIHSEDLRRENSASIPRDIALSQVLPESVSGPTLFVAMEDGIVLSFVVDQETFALSGRKSVVLGTQQARFEILPRKDGLFNIFATCEHPSLIYGSEGRIVYSAVTAENATCVCNFDSEAYPNSIILATSSHLKISQIDTERRTHVRTLPMGKTIRRIAYSSKERAFGIGSIKRELVDGEELVESAFELVEDVLFNSIGKPFILKDSNGQELIECVTRASLPISHSDSEPVERFLVGTSYLTDSATAQNAGGRLLVFGIDSNRTPFLVCSHIIKGACRQLAMMDGKIVASLVKTVVIYSYLETSTSAATLSKLATYRTSTCPIDLSITGNIIAVADLMKSVSIIQYIPGVAGTADTLVEIARHHQSCWATAVVSLGNDEWLESDQEGNLILLKRNLEGMTDSDRRRLDVIAEANLGEMLNCIRRIDVEPSPNAMVVPKAFLGTVSLLPSHHSISLYSTTKPNLLTNHRQKDQSISSPPSPPHISHSSPPCKPS